jgi:selenocysteine lyase/cysteine desulfurase
LQYLLDRGVAQIQDEELALMGRLRDELKSISDIEVHGGPHPGRQIGVVSISSELYEPHTLATILAEEYGIETRAGLHCAPGMHSWLGTKASGGTVRMSSGPLTTCEQIEAALRAFREIHKT